MTNSTLPRSARYLGYGVCALGVAYVCACIAPRVLSVWPLEWMEGASVAHALRLLRGKSLYAAPSGEHIPFIYPPLSYLPMAASMAIFGPTLWAARLPSLLASLLGAWSLGRAATRQSGHAATGLLAIGLFGFGYGYNGSFLDLARVDAVFIALLLFGTERLCAQRTAAALIAFVLACLAKQHGLWFLVAASLHLLLRDRRALPSIAIAWLALGLCCGVLEYLSGGWFSRYVFEVPRRHGLVPALLLSFVLVDLGVYLPVFLALALTGVWQHRRQPRACDLLLMAAVVASALGRAHPGGDDNVRLPAYVLVVLLAAVGFSDWSVRLAGRRARLALCAAVVVQIAMLVQSPSLFWPRPSSAATLSRLRAELRRCGGEGRTLALDHAGLTGSASVHTQAWSDLAVNHDALAVEADRAVLAALSGSDAPTAIAVSSTSPALRSLLAAQYSLCATLSPLAFPTGYQLGETRVYRRITPPP